MSCLYRTFLNDDPVLNVPEVVALEQRIAAEGTPLKELMRRAGTATAQVVMDRVSVGSKIVVLAGTGNNGGDGWVAADVLAHAGYHVVLVTPKSADALRAQPAAETAQEICAQGTEQNAGQNAEQDTVQGAKRGVEQDTVQGAPFEILILTQGQCVELDTCLSRADAVLDCILGTGFEGADVREPYATWIDCANTWRAGEVSGVDGVTQVERMPRGPRFLLAVDTPSGYSAQSGAVAQQCICADATITMIVGKTGLVAEGAKEFTGELLLAPLV